MRKFLISTFLTTLVISTNGRIINHENINNNTFNNKIMPIRNPHSKFITSITYGDIEGFPNESGKRRLTDDEIACLSEQAQYEDCFEESFDEESCKNYLNGKCHAFFTDPLSVLPSCKKIDKNQQDILVNIFNYIGQAFILACTKEGKCPLFEDFMLFYTGQYGDKHQWTSSETQDKGYIPSDSVIAENCKFPECSESGVELINGMVKLIDSSINFVSSKIVKEEGDEEFLKEDPVKVITKKSEEHKQSLKQSLKKMKKCNATSGALSMNKTISNGLMNSLVISFIFYLYMKN